MSSFEHLVSSMSCRLPGDVMVDILSRLPIKSLVQYKLVSKNWCALVENQDFSSMHLHRSNSPSSYVVICPNESTNVTKMFVVSPTTNVASSVGAPYKGLLKAIGCCNGLLCLTFYSEAKFGKSFVLCNPAIRDYKEVSPYIRTHGEVVRGMKSLHVYLGFGFDSKANDYKIVRIEQFNAGNGQIHTECDVYSKGNDCWRSTQASLDLMINNSKNETVKNYDSLHWKAERNDHIILISFDITAEIFNEIMVPKEVLSSYNDVMSLPEHDMSMHISLYLQTWLDGSLVRSVHYNGTDGSRKTCFIFMIWLAENESLVKDPMIVLSGGFYYVLASLPSRHFLYFTYGTLYMYDPADNNSDQIVGISGISHRTNAYAYKESLVTVSGRGGSRFNNGLRSLTRFVRGLIRWTTK